MRSFSEDRRPSGRPVKGEDSMLKGIIAALALGIALPAFAESDTKKDMKDTAENAKDTAKDKLGTDSGAEKTKRHAKRKARNVKKDARQKKNEVKKDVNKATDNK
jgi:hypothetical protein